MDQSIRTASTLPPRMDCIERGISMNAHCAFARFESRHMSDWSMQPEAEWTIKVVRRAVRMLTRDSYVYAEFADNQHYVKL